LAVVAPAVPSALPLLAALALCVLLSTPDIQTLPANADLNDLASDSVMAICGAAAPFFLPVNPLLLVQFWCMLYKAAVTLAYCSWPGL
jgi:hypothetical protein